VNESQLARVLLVDNDPEWLDLIKGSLPDFEVKTARTYDEALQALQAEDFYDVAIIDLNLIDSPDRRTRDGLGGRLLKTLRRDYPETRRIALTGDPPGSAMQVVSLYAVDDLLLKGTMPLSVVPEVVHAVLSRTTALPLGIRARRSERQEDFKIWQRAQDAGFERRLRHLRNEVGAATFRPDGDSAAGGLRAHLGELEARYETFRTECAEVLADFARIRDEDELSAMQERVDLLQQQFGTLRDETEGWAPDDITPQ
jgi:CheY-like chemotaxis protein